MTLIRKTGVTTVKLSNQSYDIVKAYSAATHVPIARVLEEAIDLWMSRVGEARLKILSKDKQ
jgi:hypothetical protein